MRRVIAEFLSVGVDTVEVVPGGNQGLDEFRRHDFDATVVDRAMPVLSGDEVAAQIESMAPTTPVIMLTGFGKLMEATGKKP